MSITVQKVDTAEQMGIFIRFPLYLYKDNPFYVPNLISDDKATLDKKRNGAYEFCEADFFIAYKDGAPAGRIAAIINKKANKAWNVNQVRFGWLDFIEDIDVLDALVDAVAQWGRKRGMDSMAGPLGFTDFDPEGMLIDGFDKLGTMITIYNHPYYPEFLERLGFRKDADWVEYKIKLPDTLPERFEKMAHIVMEKNSLKIRKLTRSDVRKEKYGRKLFNLINESYAHLYGYSILSEKQIDQYVSQYLSFIDLKMVSFIENSDGELVAAGITLPSLSKALQKAKGRLFPAGWFHLLNAMYFNRPEILDLLLVAIKPEYQSKGLNSILFMDLVPTLIKMGFKYAESNPELETNTKVQSLWTSFDSMVHKRRRVFVKQLQ